MSKQPLPAPTASAVGPCPTVVQIVGRPGTGSLPSTIAPPDHPLLLHCSLDFKANGIDFADNKRSCLTFLKSYNAGYNCGLDKNMVFTDAYAQSLCVIYGLNL